MIMLLLFALLTSVSFLHAMETDRKEDIGERTALLTVPATTVFQRITHHVDGFNSTLDQEFPKQKASFIMGNLAKATCECGAGTALCCGALACVANPLAQLGALIASVACISSSARDYAYALNLAEGGNNNSDACTHTTINSMRIVCCMMPQQRP